MAMTTRAASTQRPACAAPFWQRLPAILLYPLQGTALLALLVLTACTQVRLLPGIGWFLSIVVWLAIYGYAFEILRQTADGRMQAPEVVADGDRGAAIRLVGGMLLLIFGWILLTIWAPAAGMLLLAVAALMQPGFLISLALDGTLPRALNPLVTLELYRRIGWPYLLICALLFALQAAALSADQWLTKLLPSLLAEPLVAGAVIWGLFTAFHLLGYLVYQYHDRLGYEPASLDDLPAGISLADRMALEAVQRDVDAGQAIAARERLRLEVGSRAAGLPLHARYHKLLSELTWGAEHNAHARQYIDRLLAENQSPRALQILRIALQHDPAFVPQSIEQAEALAALAKQSQQSKLLLELLQAMAKAWPNTALTPHWLLQAALLFHERFGQDAEALQLLDIAAQTNTDDLFGQSIAQTRRSIKAITQ